MSDLNIKILELIDKKYSVNEMMTELNLSKEQLCKAFRKLKQIGMNFNKKFYSDGEVIYMPNKEIYIPPKVNSVDIITEPKTDTFRALCISDLHLGNESECIEAIEKAFNYCAINGIHIILIIGDFLDGIKIGRSESKIHSDPLEQIEYATKIYPFDNNILSFLILGNHDIDLLTSFGIDFAENLRSFRYDVIPIGYGQGIVNIKNDKILLSHPLRIGVSCEHDLSSNYLFLKGHSHAAKSIIGSNGYCSLTIPSLSRLFVTENEFLPGAIDLSIKFKGGYFDTIYYEHLLFGDKIYAVSSTQYALGSIKDRNFDDAIRLEEDFSKRRTKRKNKK